MGSEVTTYEVWGDEERYGVGNTIFSGAAPLHYEAKYLGAQVIDPSLKLNTAPRTLGINQSDIGSKLPDYLRTIHLKNNIDEILNIDSSLIENIDVQNKFFRELYLAFATDTYSASFKLLQMITSGKVPIDVVAIVCDSLGRFEEFTLKRLSLNVLTTLLNHKSYYIRESAALGLALLNDRRSIPALSTAFEKETRSILKATLQDVINQIKA